MKRPSNSYKRHCFLSAPGIGPIPTALLFRVGLPSHQLPNEFHQHADCVPGFLSAFPGQFQVQINTASPKAALHSPIQSLVVQVSHRRYGDNYGIQGAASNACFEE